MSEDSITCERILDSDGGLTPTDGLTSSESSISEEAERQPTYEERPESKDRHYEHPDEVPEVESPEEDSRSKGKGYLNTTYRDVLNAAIEVACGIAQRDIELLPPSQIAGSYWTSSEKEAFFSTLARVGPGNLPALSSAIVTKTELEVKYYLLLLQTHTSHDNANSTQPSRITGADGEAAYEIGERCETALDLAAEALNRHVFRHEIDAEMQRFGDDWLVDEDAAESIEERFDQRQELLTPGSEATPEGDDSITGSQTDYHSDPRIKAEHVVKANVIQDVKPADAVDTSVINQHNSTAELLRPQSFLQLSKRFFMNSATEKECNWKSVGSFDLASSTPAMFRSSLDDFREIAVDLTRRLVRASLFQATSRFRARDGRGSEAIVTTADIDTAAELLGLSMKRETYWSTIARRCGVEVYSERDKFCDGRPGTKTGVKLTWQEVEAELGYPSERSNSEADDEMEDELEEKAEATYFQPKREATSKSLEEDSSDDKVSATDRSDLASESNHGNEVLSKRKRSPSLFQADENDGTDEENYLDFVDTQASRAEEHKLLEMLGKKVSPVPESESGNVSIPSQGKLTKRAKIAQTHWRRLTRHEAEWELHSGLIHTIQ